MNVKVFGNIIAFILLCSATALGAEHITQESWLPKPPKALQVPIAKIAASTVEKNASATIRQPTGTRTGFSLKLGTNLGTCLPSGVANCSNTYPGPAIEGAMEWRFWYLGLALEFDHGLNFVTGDGASDVKSTNMHLNAMLKGYYPLEYLEIFLGVGLGYSNIAVTESATKSGVSWTALWQGVKVSGGVWLDLESYGLPEGFSLDVTASFFLNTTGTRCTEYAGAGPCISSSDLEGDQKDIANQLQLGTGLRYTF